MKIGLVRRGYSATGGAEAYLVRLAAALAGMGHVPVLVTTRDWPESRWIGRDIVRLPGKSPEEFARAFRETDTRCDVHLSLERVPGCEVFRAGDGVHAAWLERRAAFEPFWKRATRWMNPKHKQLLRLEREVFDPANTRSIIANSRLVRGEIVRHYGFPADRIEVVYNGISAPMRPADRGTSREKLGIEHDTLCLLFLGTGWERKGLRTAIKATEMLDGANIVVAGRGPADSFRSRRAIFTGPTNELAALFGAADIFVAPTYYDPFSNACLEAMLAGLPVITTSANGFSEIIEPGIHGGIVPAGDARALADEIDKWEDPEKRAAARAACIARAGEFTIARNARETMRVLESTAR